MNNSIELINYEGPVLRLIRDGQKFIVKDQYNQTVSKLTIQGVLMYCSGDITIYDSKGKEWSFVKEHDDAKIKMNKLSEFLFQYHPKENEPFTWDRFLQDIEEYPSEDWPDMVQYGYETCITLIKQKIVNYHPPKFRKKPKENTKSTL